MFQYHGWVTVQSSAWEDDEVELDKAFAGVNAATTHLREVPGLIDLRWVNAVAQLHLAGFINHRRNRGDEVIDVFRRVGEIAQGSYGLLYFRDDEDPNLDRRNEFQVYVMRKGKVTLERDPFLSPCIPLIEDEEG